MGRDPEARTLVLQSAALEAKAELLLDQLVSHTSWLRRVVDGMSHDRPDDNGGSQRSEITPPQPMDGT